MFALIHLLHPPRTWQKFYLYIMTQWEACPRYIFGRGMGGLLNSVSFNFSVSLILQSMHKNASEPRLRLEIIKNWKKKKRVLKVKVRHGSLWPNLLCKRQDAVFHVRIGFNFSFSIHCCMTGFLSSAGFPLKFLPLVNFHIFSFRQLGKDVVRAEMEDTGILALRVTCKT